MTKPTWHRHLALAAFTCGAMAGAGSASAYPLINPATARHFTASLILPDTLQAAARFGAAFAVGDFNGDGFEDLAVGMPYQGGTFFGVTVEHCGAVIVVYGARGGLGTAVANPGRGSLHYAQGFPPPQNLARFGWALAAGDFDGDGFDDLAVGAPGYDIAASAEGAVYELRGGATGLSTLGTRWDQDQALQGVPENSEQFGTALAAADFNADGFADLAIGIPEDRVGGVAAGSVAVLYGAGAGLSATGDELWNQDIAGVPGGGETGDFFGAALASGDLNVDGEDDLAIGVPGEAIGSAGAAGAVNVLYGVDAGLATQSGSAISAIITQDSILPGGAEGSEAGDRFGQALQVVTHQGFAATYLAVGTPEEDDIAGDNGLVQAVESLADGPWLGDGAIYHYGVDGGQLGSSFASGRINAQAQGWDLLVSGSPAHDQGRGAVTVGVFTFASAFEGDSALFGLPPQAQARFGAAVAVGDFNGRGPDEVVIGSPLWDRCIPAPCLVDAGLITVADDTLLADGFDVDHN